MDELIEIRDIKELFKYPEFQVLRNLKIDIKCKVCDEIANHKLRIVHNKPGCSSEVNIRIALFGESSLNIPVEIVVEKGATGTSTRFKATIYMMSKQAKAQITPALLIHEKDIVAASHGVVIKNIKPKDTYYQQSRGIKFTEACKMLIGI